MKRFLLVIILLLLVAPGLSLARVSKIPVVKRIDDLANCPSNTTCVDDDGNLGSGSVTIGTTLSLGATNETAFTDGDTTPSVASDCNFVTANTGATSITRLDDVTQGELGIIRVNDANTTFDCTSSNIIGNGGVDYSAASGDLIFYYSYDGTNVVIGITKPIAGGGDSDAIHDNVAGEIAAVSGKATVIDADMILIEDSADSNAKKMVTLTNFWANYLKAKADVLYEPVDATILKDADIGVNVQAYSANMDTDSTNDITDDGAGEIAAITEKASPVSGDMLLIEDSADSNAKKMVQIGNLPTGSDSAAIHDNVASEISAITEKASPVSGDMLIIEDSADSNNKKMVQVGNLPSSGGDVTSVLGDTTGDVPLLFQDASAFTGSDATPDVSTALHWITADTTTYTDFDGTPVDGQQLWIYCKHAATFDLTSSGIEAWNRSSDLTATVGFVAVLIYEDDDNQWHFINAPDAYETLGDNGIVVNNSGTPVARSIAGAGLAAASNADGTAGNPTITVPAEDAAGLNTGTATDEAATADAIAGSTFGTFFITLRAYAPGTALETGDGKDYWTVPPELNGWNLVSVFGAVYTVSSSGTPEFQIYNLTQTADMLSTTLTIDVSEFNSSDPVSAAVINTSEDDLATGDILRLDVDTAGTDTTGGDVILGFRLP
jgi:hypothetical protein